MRRAAVVAGKDLRVLWSSPLPYVVGAVFSATLGILYVSQLQARRQALIQPMFPLAAFLLLVTVPVLTMRSFAEESRTGTLDVLLAVPVRPRALVPGKWLAAWVSTLALIAPTLVFVWLLHLYGNPEPGPIEAGYLGLVLVAALLAALGVLASTCTTSQPLAAMVALFAALLLWFAHVGSDTVSTGAAVARFSISERLRTFAGGAIDTGDLAFFVLATAAALVLAAAVLGIRRLR
ncbi:MAG: gliding motility-associated transport system permease protein [Actinomycetota bacterium]|nr:gliding motility-associated transport system permease protein [Actinomycetota bacterium]